MSYCRGEVYLIGLADPEEGEGLWECCGCKMKPERATIHPGEGLYGIFQEMGKADGENPYSYDYWGSTYFDKLEEALEHLLAHREMGHHVPETALDRLRAEIAGEEYSYPLDLEDLCHELYRPSLEEALQALASRDLRDPEEPERPDDWVDMDYLDSEWPIS